MNKLQHTVSQPVAGAQRGGAGPHIARGQQATSGAVAPVKAAEPEARAGGKAARAATVLRAEKLVKNYRKGKHVIPVLRSVDFVVPEGQFTAIVGQSGSGKSTLLHLLGLLDQPDSGEIHFESQRIDQLPPRRRDELRNSRIGMIFQFYHLLPELTALENVLMPLMISCGAWRYWRARREWQERGRHLLELVGLSHRMQHRPRELSGGEMQRTAIARALVAQPKLLLADEPTGNLDRANGQDILGLLRTLNAQQKLTIVMVTHDLAIARQADRTAHLVEGRMEPA